MKLYFIRILRWCLLWLEPVPSPAPVQAPPDPCYARVAELVHSIDREDQNGEWKRHQVYARLVKEFPDRRKRDLAYLIESILQEQEN